MVFVNEKSSDITKNRTVDYDRNAIHTCIESDRENVSRFTLTVNDQNIYFSALLERDTSKTICWKVFEVEPLPTSHNSKEGILKLIGESIEGYGIRHSKIGLDGVNVTFSPNFE